MTLDEKFQSLTEQWQAHCAGFGFGVDSRKYIDCDAYRAIVQLGEAALPLIREAYARERHTGTYRWDSVLKDIMGTTFAVPAEFSDDPEKIKVYALGWLDRHLTARTKTARFTT